LVFLPWSLSLVEGRRISDIYIFSIDKLIELVNMTQIPPEKQRVPALGIAENPSTHKSRKRRSKSMNVTGNGRLIDSDSMLPSNSVDEAKKDLAPFSRSFESSFVPFEPSSSLRHASKLAAEVEEGNHEYKYKLTNLTKDQLRHRISQLAWRLNESLDDDSAPQTAIYQVGVDDDGTPVGLTRPELEESLRNLASMADAVGCSLTVKEIRIGVGGRDHVADDVKVSDDEERLTAEVVFHKIAPEMLGAMHLQVAVAGDVFAGKSTLIGVMLSGQADNGHGSARTHVFRYNHEIISGMTSSVSDHSIFFDMSGKILNHASTDSLQRMSMDQTCQRVASFIDLAGHVKYLKTTLHGMSSRCPSLCLVCVCADTQTVMSAMMLEHLGMSIALQLPLALVVTKIDLVNTLTLQAVISTLQRLLKCQGREAVVMNSVEDVIEQVSHPSPAVVPIFQISSVTGIGLDLLQDYIFRIPTDSSIDHDVDLDTDIYPTSIRILACYSRSKIMTQVHESASDSNLPSHAAEDGGSSSSVEVFGQSFGYADPVRRSSLSDLTRLSDIDVPTADMEESSAVVEMMDGLIRPDTVCLVVIQRGMVKVSDELYLGPGSPDQLFIRVRVTSLRVHDIMVRRACKGQCATLRLQPIEEVVANDISNRYLPRRSSAGLVLLSCYPSSSSSPAPEELLPMPSAVWEFTARLVIVNHPSKVSSCSLFFNRYLSLSY
jgi:GTPase